MDQRNMKSKKRQRIDGKSQAEVFIKAKQSTHMSLPTLRNEGRQSEWKKKENEANKKKRWWEIMK